MPPSRWPADLSFVTSAPGNKKLKKGRKLQVKRRDSGDARQPLLLLALRRQTHCLNGSGGPATHFHEGLAARTKSDHRSPLAFTWDLLNASLGDISKEYIHHCNM